MVCFDFFTMVVYHYCALTPPPPRHILPFRFVHTSPVPLWILLPDAGLGPYRMPCWWILP